jgi:hypothetical protein
VLKRFPRLEQLQLPRASELGLGFDGGPWCGNAYMGPGGTELGRSVTRRASEATDVAGELVVAAELPHLKKLGVGGTWANLTVGDDGKTSISWPWSGRMDEYTAEMWAGHNEDEF